ncbi:hypothetical protein [Corynebacterium phoceense]|uniref:hypothetical protein n=1 Tax=Corynebacterium phoceense TaxID=1686286 RepID=UPI0018A96C0D|nr:hypothetical protein [Corynebacterium phoceense]MBF9011158.1 hypothetical protein [Corynebacterium phoceense]
MSVTVGQSPAYGDHPAQEINVVAERDGQRHYYPKTVLGLDGTEHRNLVDLLLGLLPDAVSRAPTQ